MTDLTLGFKPLQLAVNLTPDADFDTVISTADDTDWPDGAVIELRFNTPDADVWAADIAGPTATWSVDKAAVNALIASFSTSPRVRLFYGDVCWAIGRVNS